MFAGRPPLAPALLLGAAGLAAAFAPPVEGLPLFGYASIALILAAGVAAMPWLARLMIAPLARLPAPVPVRLAAARLAGAPDQAAVALCGLVASAGLMAAMGLMVSSFRGSVDEWLGAILPADVYLRGANAETSGLDPALQSALAALNDPRGSQRPHHRLAPPIVEQRLNRVHTTTDATLVHPTVGHTPRKEVVGIDPAVPRHH